MIVKYYKVTKDDVIDFFLGMSMDDYLFKYYPICEQARALKMTSWDFAIQKIKEGVLTFKGKTVKLK